MQLSSRLNEVLRFLKPLPYMADIGSDHALLAIAAVQSGKIERAIATDINAAPLQAARAAINSAGLQECIILQQADGLRDINKDYLQQIVIAGMGGLLIRRILAEAACDPERVELIKRAVLQPNNREAELRFWLAESG